MTATTPVDEVQLGQAAEPPGPDGGDAVRARPVPPGWFAAAVRWAVALVAAVALFALFLLLKGADPVDALAEMWDSAAGDTNGIGETFIRAAPLLFGALAVGVPARAGLFNIGGEGQLVMGAVGAYAVAHALGDGAPRPVTVVLMGLGAAACGAAWAGIAAVLRLVAATNEAITTLLLNYVAGLVLTWLVFEPWKDPTSLGQAYSSELDDAARLPVVWGDRVHAGIFVALLAAVATWSALNRTRWGFRLRVYGGNPAAARRAGFRVRGLALSAMLVGGALAGLGGMVEVAGVEARLRPDLLAGFGYLAFLTSWLARHHPLKTVGAAVLLGGIAVGGFGLKLATGLSGAAVQVLTAIVLLAVLGFAQARPGAEGKAR